MKNVKNNQNMNKNFKDFNWDEFENGASSNVSKNFKNIMNNVNVNNVKTIDEKMINEIFDQIRSTRVESWCRIKSCTTVTSKDGTFTGQFISTKSDFKLEGGNLELKVTSNTKGGDLKIRVSYKALKRLVRLGIRVWNAYVAFYNLIEQIKSDTKRSMRRLVSSGDIKITKNF